MFERHTTWVQSGCKLCQHNGESGGLFEKEGGLKGRRVTPYMASPSFLTITTQQLGHHSTHHSNAPPQKYSSLQVTLGSTTNVAIFYTTSAHSGMAVYGYHLYYDRATKGLYKTRLSGLYPSLDPSQQQCTIQSLGTSSHLAPNNW